MRSNAPPAAKSSSSSEISMRRCSPPSKCRRPTGSPIEFCWGAARAAADGSYPWRRPFCSPLGWLPSGRASGPPISSGWKRSRTWPTSRGHSRLSTRCRAVFSSRCFPSRAWRPCVRWGKSSTCAYARWPVNWRATWSCAHPTDPSGSRKIVDLDVHRQSVTQGDGMAAIAIPAARGALAIVAASLDHALALTKSFRPS